MTQKEKAQVQAAACRVQELATQVTGIFEEINRIWSLKIIRDPFSQESEDLEEAMNAVGDNIDTLWTASEMLHEYVDRYKAQK